jgi:hypothetical protein
MHHYRCQNFYISARASERIVDTLKFFPHNYQIPQLSSTGILLMATNKMTNALQNPSPTALTHVGDGTISSLTAGGNFQTQITKSAHSRPYNCTSQGHSTHMPHRIIQSNICFYHPSAAPNKITDNTSRSRHNQRAITSEGCHINDASPVTSEDANLLTKSLSRNLSQDNLCDMDTTLN